MLIITRVCLVLALVLGGASIYLSGELQKDKSKLLGDVGTAKKAADKAKADLTAAKTEAQTKLKDVEQARAEAKLLAAQVTEAKATATTLQGQVDELKAKLASGPGAQPTVNTGEMDALKAKITAAEQARDAAAQQAKDAQDKISALTAQVTAADGEKKVINEKLKESDAKVRYYENKEGVPLPDGLTGKVLYYDKTWNFTVLDIGKKKGVLPSGIMILHRGTEIVGKVRIATVDDDCCIADFMGDVKKKEPKPGDMAIP